ncbi:MAG TPA: PadR family transcriptional regulator [Cytophagales bacterium]|nr:PadR family transcriptional regulator [Cytophagales bacterium]
MTNIGTLEEMVLLVVAIVHEEAYGLRITEEYNEQMGQNISLSAVHTVLRRLEKKGLLESYMGGATAERGGRRKRLFRLTQAGNATIRELQEQRMRLWNQLPPNLSWS